MDFIIGIGAKIAEYTVAPVGRQLGYLFRYKTNVSELRTQLEDLNNATQRMERRVNEALNNCHEIEADVQTWQKNAEQISGEATAFLNPESHANALCSCGSPHHLVTRHQLSRKAKKMSVDVRAVVLKNKEFDSILISYPRQPEGSSATPAKGYESFDSRSTILKNIMAAVGDAANRGSNTRIGLYGMGGIGKTMLAKEITRLAEEEKLFSKVVMTTVSQTPNIKDIQQHIAEKLGLKLEEKDSTSKRAELLGMRMKRDESKILLILDDVWNELDLEAIGIHEECRMLITSRDQQVLRNFMGVAESNVFLIEALESSEAINLFKSIIGDTKTDYINALAREIVYECGGLPIAIATVAHALKHKKEETIWKDALRRLKSSNVEKKVYSSIKLSYDFLGSHEEEAKSLLLLCALHKEDEEIQVENLIRYSMGWRLLQDIYTVEDARNRVNSLVDTLKSHCLLLDGWSWSKSIVKMHDVIRDVCIKIAREDHGHRMMKNIAMCEDEKTKAFKAISFLDYDNFDNLPSELECPSLELLLLSSWSTLESIPDEFFKQTGLLKVLVMNGTRLTSLPSSFASLQNLQTLCLRNSSLEDIAVIGELKNLKALDLSECPFIERLPKEIGALKRLQVLDLRGCRNLRVIEAHVISNLTQMEELYLPHEFEGWDKNINEEGGIRNASLIEIKSMQRLTALHIFVPSEHTLPQGRLFTEKLERYQICIGSRSDSVFSRDEFSSWKLDVSLSQLDQIYGAGLDLVMKGSEYLSLDGLNCVNNVFHDLHKDGFRRLKQLSFENNDGFHHIINSTHHEAFPSLESLTLERLRSLEGICHGNKLPRGSFNQLRKVDVKNCGRLKNLFPLCVAKLLHEITVENCEMMEEIIVREDGDDHSSSLELRSLHFNSLPKFVQFYCSNYTAPGESHHSKPLFSEMVSFPNLEALTMKGMNIEKLWPDQLIVSSTSYMQSLTSLKVEMCHNLKYLFSFSLAQKFVNLKSIQVKDCNAMEDIIRVVDQLGEEETHTKTIDLFPKLEFIKLEGQLSSLQRFCSSAADSCIMVFPLLSKLIVENCPAQASVDMLVSKQPFFNEKTAFPNLEELVVENCNNFKSLLSSAMVRSVVQLKRLYVKGCEKIEEVIVSDHDEEYSSPSSSSSGASIKAILPFGKLESLQLKKLPNLKRFCEGDYYCIECPLLSQMRIVKCPKLKEFMGDKRASSSSSLSCTTTNNIIGEDMDRMVSTFNTQSLFKHSNKILGAPSFMNFPNLETLEVWGCDGLRYLFSSATAATLLQLKQMKIRHCKEMNEIIIDQHYIHSDTTHDHHSLIVFQNLNQLNFDTLPSLQSFYSGNKVTMSFPNLAILYINRCPQMKRFSDGIVTTLLKTIWVDGKHEILETDVNTTLAKLVEKVDNDSDFRSSNEVRNLGKSENNRVKGTIRIKLRSRNK